MLDGTIIQLHDVQDHRAVGRIFIVPVLIPLARGVVDLHTADPQEVINLDLRPEEVGTSMMIEHPGIDDLDASISETTHRDEASPQTTGPYIVEEGFHGRRG